MHIVGLKGELWTRGEKAYYRFVYNKYYVFITYKPDVSKTTSMLTIVNHFK